MSAKSAFSSDWLDYSEYPGPGYTYPKVYITQLSFQDGEGEGYFTISKSELIPDLQVGIFIDIIFITRPAGAIHGAEIIGTHRFAEDSFRVWIKGGERVTA